MRFLVGKTTPEGSSSSHFLSSWSFSHFFGLDTLVAHQKLLFFVSQTLNCLGLEPAYGKEVQLDHVCCKSTVQSDFWTVSANQQFPSGYEIRLGALVLILGIPVYQRFSAFFGPIHSKIPRLGSLSPAGWLVACFALLLGCLVAWLLGCLVACFAWLLGCLLCFVALLLAWLVG